MKINQDCELNIKATGTRVVEISTVYDNRFIRKVYVGYTIKTAEKKFRADLKELGKEKT